MVLNVTSMQAVTWSGNPFHVNVSTLPIPQLLDPTDAILKVSLSSISSADIHTYNGAYEDKEVPWVMGHEALGIIVEVGNLVTTFSTGDRVVILGEASNGLEGLSTAELIGLGLGPDHYPTTGCQAEYVRVPFANDNLLAIPKTNRDDPSKSESIPASLDLDYLLASSIFATGWAALDLAGFQPGDSVAVFGAGPVGLMAVYSAIRRGASRVFLLDDNRQRLSVAGGLGAMPIDLTKSDPITKVLREEPEGVVRTVDCIGIEAASQQQQEEDKVLQNMIAITKTTGGIGRVGTFKGSNSSSPSAWQLILPTFQIVFSSFLRKGAQVRTGAIDSALIAPKLIEMVSAGKAKPSFIVSSTISVEEAPQFYERVSRHLETKAVIKFSS